MSRRWKKNLYINKINGLISENTVIQGASHSMQR